MVPELSQVPIQMRGMFDLNPDKIFLGVDREGRIYKTANSDEAASKTEICARLIAALNTIVEGDGKNRIRQQIISILQSSRYRSRQSTEAVYQAAVGVLPQPASSQSAREQVSHTVDPSQFFTTREEAGLQVRVSVVGSFRFYQRAGKSHAIYIKFSENCERISILDYVNLPRLTYALIHTPCTNLTAFISLMDSIFIESLLERNDTSSNVGRLDDSTQRERFSISPAAIPSARSVCSDQVSGRISLQLASTHIAPSTQRVRQFSARDIASLIVADEPSAINALINIGDFRFYTKPAIPSENQNLKRIMIKLPIQGNQKTVIPDSTSFDQFLCDMQSLEVFIKLIGPSSTNADEAESFLDRNNISFLVSPLGKPTKIFMKFPDHIITFNIAETIEPMQLLHEMKKNSLLG